MDTFKQAVKYKYGNKPNSNGSTISSTLFHNGFQGMQNIMLDCVTATDTDTSSSSSYSDQSDYSDSMQDQINPNHHGYQEDKYQGQPQQNGYDQQIPNAQGQSMGLQQNDAQQNGDARLKPDQQTAPQNSFVSELNYLQQDAKL